MDTLINHVDALREQLHDLKNRWGSHLAFWDFIATQAHIAPRGAYNFASGTQHNPRLSTIEGIERAIVAAEAALCLREAHLSGEAPYGALCQ